MGRQNVSIADDYAIHITAATLAGLREAAAENAPYLRQKLREPSLALNENKTKNPTVSPGLPPEGIRGRTPDLRYPTSKKRVEQQHRGVGAIIPEAPGFVPREEKPLTDVNLWEGFLYPAATTLRVLGLIIDMHSTLDVHC